MTNPASTDILTEFDSNAERTALEIRRLRNQEETLTERLAETWAMASKYQRTAVILSHKTLREIDLRPEGEGAV